MTAHKTMAILAATTVAVGLGSTSLLVTLGARTPAAGPAPSVTAPAPRPVTSGQVPVAAAGASSTAEATPGVTPAPTARATPHTKLYFGVAAPGLPTSTVGESRFIKAAGKKPNLVQYYQSFDGGFDVSHLRAITHRGQLPMVTWEPWNHTRPTTNPQPLRAITAGRFDLYLRHQAVLLKNLGSLVAIRLAPEMNGSWFPWGMNNTNANTPADYVAMYRHVHNVFSAVGARNIIWVWSPNVVSGRPNVPLAPLYPGRRYVDIVGVVGYLRTDAVHDTFDQIYGSTFAQLDTFASNKPILIAETGVAAGPGQVSLLRTLFQGVLTTPRLIGFVWFDFDATLDWRLEGHPAEIQAFRKGIASPRFAGSRA